MTVNPDIEESIVDYDLSLQHGLMGLSLLACLLSPWALLTSGASVLGYITVPEVVSISCALLLVVALPGLLQLLASHRRQDAN